MSGDWSSPIRLAVSQTLESTRRIIKHRFVILLLPTSAAYSRWRHRASHSSQAGCQVSLKAFSCSWHKSMHIIHTFKRSIHMRRPILLFSLNMGRQENTKEQLACLLENPSAILLHTNLGKIKIQ